MGVALGVAWMVGQGIAQEVAQWGTLRESMGKAWGIVWEKALGIVLGIIWRIAYGIARVKALGIAWRIA